MNGMGTMERIAALAVVTALCAVVVRKQAPGIAMVLVLLGVAMILRGSLSAISGIRTVMEELRAAAGLSPAVVAPVIKTVGVALLTSFAAELCRDAQEGGLASFVETAGAAVALFLALPLLETVLAMITGLLL